MDKDNQKRMDRVNSQIASVRNLRPKAFELVTDHEADIKQRWIAFDELYEAVREGLLQKGFSPDLILTTPRSPDLPAHFPDPTEAQNQQCMRHVVAIGFMVEKFGTSNDAVAHSVFQADLLTPPGLNPDTGRLTMSSSDMMLLGILTNLLRTEMSEDWDTFYKGDTEPAAKRKLAFRRIYAVVGAGWMEHSLYPKTLTPENRQKQLILAMMCHVPNDQWGEKDLLQLYEDLLPIEEPDWDDPKLFPPMPK
jgi:hypothetical protein